MNETRSCESEMRKSHAKNKQRLEKYDIDNPLIDNPLTNNEGCFEEKMQNREEYHVTTT